MAVSITSLQHLERRTQVTFGEKLIRIEVLIFEIAKIIKCVYLKTQKVAKVVGDLIHTLNAQCIGHSLLAD